jgi:hypothetical protein
MAKQAPSDYTEKGYLIYQPPVMRPPQRSLQPAFQGRVNTPPMDAVLGFSKAYLIVWVVYCALALPLTWLAENKLVNAWYSPGGLDFAVGLALVTGLFGRRYLSTEATAVSFVGALAFSHAFERGIFAVTGLLVAIAIALLLAAIIGGAVWAVTSSQRPYRAEFDPRFAETDRGIPSPMPLAWRSLVRRARGSQNILRRAAIVIGPLFLLGMCLNLIAQGMLLLFGESVRSYDAIIFVSHMVGGAVAGAMLGWLQHQFIPDLPFRRNTQH